ncbi:MAG: glycosyltransferase family 4 protein [Candidatus Sumerlaeaceae bacterium]|nr:glycosyltransferase family 4 protein [Candidatus Sumerlaeaceae bacterium]
MKIHHIVQIVPTLNPGDAIGDFVMLIHRLAEQWGCTSALYAGQTGQGYAATVHSLARLPAEFEKPTAVFYHHGTGAPAAEVFASTVASRRYVVYHNVTPPKLLETVPALAARSHEGLHQLTMLAQSGARGVAVSQYNAQDLLRAGFHDVEILPLAVGDDRRMELELPSHRRESPLRVLHVGRLLPHKAIDDVISVFALACKSSPKPMNLRIIGSDAESGSHLRTLQNLAEQVAPGCVTFCGKLSDQQLVAEYAQAHAYLCMSRHEGFCVPIVESMFAGIPVVAAANGAIPETVGTSGIVLSDTDPAVFAEALLSVLTEERLRSAVIAAQRRRAENFSQSKLAERIGQLLDSGGTPAREQAPS